MQPQFEIPQSKRQLKIFIASLALTAMLSPALVKGQERCFPDSDWQTTQHSSDSDVNWDIRSMLH